MKMLARITAVIFVMSFAINAHAQSVKLLYDKKPNVRVVYDDYFIYFSLKDIQDALKQLPQAQQQEFAEANNLSPEAQITVNIERGQRANAMVLEPLLKRHVGVYLLGKGKAYIETNKGKKLSAINMGERSPDRTDLKGYTVYDIDFQDPARNKEVFSGTGAASLK